MPTVATELLLAESERYRGRATIVLGGEAALPNAIGGEAIFWPTDVRERDAALVTTIDAIVPASADLILIPAPPDRPLLRRWLLTADDLARPGAIIIVVGANAEGGKSAIADASALLGTPIASTFRAKHRIGVFRLSEIASPSWAHDAGIAPGTWSTFTVPTPAGELALQTRAGVFAGPRLDDGTKVLLDALQVNPGDSVLDVGCGQGIIGIAAARAGARSVTLTDVNLFAIDAARRNLSALKIDGHAIASDVYAALGNETFDLIVSNPPFHRGKTVDLTVADRLIASAPTHLASGGRLVIVANAFLSYGSAMGRVFPHVETIAQTRQYHVLCGWR